MITTRSFWWAVSRALIFFISAVRSTGPRFSAEGPTRKLRDRIKYSVDLQGRTQTVDLKILNDHLKWWILPGWNDLNYDSITYGPEPTGEAESSACFGLVFPLAKRECRSLGFTPLRITFVRVKPPTLPSASPQPHPFFSKTFELHEQDVLRVECGTDKTLRAGEERALRAADEHDFLAKFDTSRELAEDRDWYATPFINLNLRALSPSASTESSKGSEVSAASIERPRPGLESGLEFERGETGKENGRKKERALHDVHGMRTLQIVRTPGRGRTSVSGKTIGVVGDFARGSKKGPAATAVYAFPGLRALTAKELPDPPGTQSAQFSRGKSLTGKIRAEIVSVFFNHATAGEGELAQLRKLGDSAGTRLQPSSQNVYALDPQTLAETLTLRLRPPSSPEKALFFRLKDTAVLEVAQGFHPDQRLLVADADAKTGGDLPPPETWDQVTVRYKDVRLSSVNFLSETRHLHSAAYRALFGDLEGIDLTPLLRPTNEYKKRFDLQTFFNDFGVQCNVPYSIVKFLTDELNYLCNDPKGPLLPYEGDTWRQIHRKLKAAFPTIELEK